VGALVEKCPFVGKLNKYGVLWVKYKQNVHLWVKLKQNNFLWVTVYFFISPVGNLKQKQPSVGELQTK